MRITDDICYEILKYFTGIELEQKRLINSTFNQIITNNLNLYPFIQFPYYNLNVDEIDPYKELVFVVDDWRKHWNNQFKDGNLNKIIFFMENIRLH